MIALLHVDDDVVVADKPSGIVVHSGGMTQDTDVARSRVEAALGAKVWTVHRLDRGTSGALVFARSAEIARALSHAFEHGEVEKRYVALVRGRLSAPVHVDHAIPRAEDTRAPRVPAVSDVAPLWTGETRSFVLVLPRTGRFHQVRRHLKHLRHPVLGDANYGDGKANRAARAELGLARLALHAWTVALNHPRSGARLFVAAPIPADLDAPLAKAGVPEALRRDVAALDAASPH